MFVENAIVFLERYVWMEKNSLFEKLVRLFVFDRILTRKFMEDIVNVTIFPAIASMDWCAEDLTTERASVARVSASRAGQAPLVNARPPLTLA